MNNINEIIREPTTEERKDFQNIGYKEDVAKHKFETELSTELQKAIKKKMPFADKAARIEFNDYYEQATKNSLRRNGFVDLSEIRPMKTDWKRYSDLANFELLDEGETSDGNLTKHNPGLNVMVAWKKYQFKGMFHTYTIMESGPDAILRARKKLRELEGDTKPKEKK